MGEAPAGVRQDGVGEPDGLERLWTPHRMSYVRGEEDGEAARPRDPGCPFCAIVARLRADEDGTATPGARGAAEDLVVARGRTTWVVLNLYPYNPGHLMVLPYRHVADLTELDEEETAELMLMTKQAITAIRSVAQPHAFNTGLNLGSAAGGSLAAHLHQHVVPRWAGDANFLTVTAGTKTLPQLLGDTRDLLAGAWPR